LSLKHVPNLFIFLCAISRTISMIGGAFWGGVAVLGFLGFTGSEVGLSTSAR